MKKKSAKAAGTTIQNCTFTNNGGISDEAARALSDIAIAASDWAKTLRAAADAIKGTDQVAVKIDHHNDDVACW